MDTAQLGLSAAALVCTIIELGISAFYVSTISRGYKDYYGDLASRYDFLLFCSIWTFLVAAFLLAFPFMRGRKTGTTGSSRMTSSIMLGLISVTMIFWLAGFAAFAAWFYQSPVGLNGTLLAFAIILWLIFLALMVIGFLQFSGRGKRGVV